MTKREMWIQIVEQGILPALRLEADGDPDVELLIHDVEKMIEVADNDETFEEMIEAFRAVADEMPLPPVDAEFTYEGRKGQDAIVFKTQMEQAAAIRAIDAGGFKECCISVPLVGEHNFQFRITE